jgi:1-acyl-sn-glycerol-3-phosphate acyltransferase
MRQRAPLVATGHADVTRRPHDAGVLRIPLRLFGVALCVGAGILVALFLGRCTVRTRRAIVRTWARTLLWTTGVQVRACGSLPRTTSLLVANHVSWLDIVTMAAIEPATFVCKAEVAAWPLVGMLAARAGSLFVQRRQFRAIYRVTRQMGARLDAGDAVAVFPEGTTSEGTTVQRFATGVFQPAVARGLPVTPIAIAYSNPDAGFVGDMTFAASLVRVLRSRGLVAYLTFLAPIDSACAGRRAVSAEAYRRIAAVLAAPPHAAEYRPPARSFAYPAALGTDSASRR